MTQIAPNVSSSFSFGSFYLLSSIYSSSFQLRYLTGGQWLPFRGRDMVILVSFPLSKRWWVQTLRATKKISHKMCFLRWMFSTHINFPIKIFLLCSYCLSLTTRSSLFSSSFLNLLSKTDSVYPSFALSSPVHQARVKGRKSSLSSWVLNNSPIPLRNYPAGSAPSVC